MCIGQPSVQYLQAVQPICGTFSMMDRTSWTSSISFSVSGSKSVKVRILSCICSSVLIPERMVITPGREPTKRSAQEATDASGRAALYFASSSGASLASVPPFTGSMMIMGMFRLCRIL